MTLARPPQSAPVSGGASSSSGRHSPVRHSFGQLLWPVGHARGGVLPPRPGGREHGGVTLGTIILPGVLGMFVALGMLLVVQQLAADREDGTLLRAKATPNGIRGLPRRQARADLGDDPRVPRDPPDPRGLPRRRPRPRRAGVPGSPSRGCSLLGLVATQTIGAMLGSLVSSQRGAGPPLAPDPRAHRDLGHLRPDHRLPGGCRASPRSSRSTGSASACARPSFPTTRPSSRSASRGASWRPRRCSAPGRSRARARADRAAPDGAPGVGIERREAPREGAAPGRGECRRRPPQRSVLRLVIWPVSKPSRCSPPWKRACSTLMQRSMTTVRPFASPS